MNSHMKAEITCALKNFVGINGHKDYLPHFRLEDIKIFSNIDIKFGKRYISKKSLCSF